MSNNIYLRINGNVQGNISAGCSSYDSLGNIKSIFHKISI